MVDVLAFVPNALFFLVAVLIPGYATFLLVRLMVKESTFNVEPWNQFKSRVISIWDAAPLGSNFNHFFLISLTGFLEYVLFSAYFASRLDFKPTDSFGLLFYYMVGIYFILLLVIFTSYRFLLNWINLESKLEPKIFFSLDAFFSFALVPVLAFVFFYFGVVIFLPSSIESIQKISPSELTVFSSGNQGEVKFVILNQGDLPISVNSITANCNGSSVEVNSSSPSIPFFIYPKTGIILYSDFSKNNCINSYIIRTSSANFDCNVSPALSFSRCERIFSTSE